MKDNKNSVKENSVKENSVLSSAFWQPTSLLRWKKVEMDEIRYNKVLQQLWKSDRGEYEWYDVPEEA